MSTIPRTRERTATPEELAEDRRRYLEAQDARSPVSDPEPVPGKSEPGRAVLEGWALVFKSAGTEQLLRMKCPKEELKHLATRLVEGDVASWATAEHTTTEIVCEVEEFLERTTTIETTTQVDWAVSATEDGAPALVTVGPQS
jgi:hypothetical protein